MTEFVAPAERRMFAIGLRVLAGLLFAGMMATVKLASERGIALPEIMFWRQLLALPVIVTWIMWGPGFGAIRTTRFGTHVRRGAIGLLGMAFNLGSYILLPLAEATAIGFTTPIFATLLSVVLLNEKVGVHRIAAIVAGFIGVLIVIQPGNGHIAPLGAAVGLGASFLVSLAAIQVRDLALTDPPHAIVFWFAALSVPPLALALPFSMTTHDAHEWLLLAGCGILGGFGQILLTTSLRYAPVSTVIAMDYAMLIWTTLTGWLIWDNLPPGSTWVGAPVIVASGLYIAWREHRLSISRAKEFVA